MWRRNQGRGSIPPHTMCPTSGPHATRAGSVPCSRRWSSSAVSQQAPGVVMQRQPDPLLAQPRPIRLSVSHSSAHSWGRRIGAVALRVVPPPSPGVGGKGGGPGEEGVQPQGPGVDAPARAPPARSPPGWPGRGRGPAVAARGRPPAHALPGRPESPPGEEVAVPPRSRRGPCPGRASPASDPGRGGTVPPGAAGAARPGASRRRSRPPGSRPASARTRPVRRTGRPPPPSPRPPPRPPPLRGGRNWFQAGRAAGGHHLRYLYLPAGWVAQ